MIKGRIQIVQGGVKFEGHNEIHLDLIANLGLKLYQDVDFSLSNYFTVFTNQIAQFQDADGIILRDTEGNFYTAPTTLGDTGNVLRKRWQTVITPTEAFQLNGMHLGKELLNPSGSTFPDMFQINYAFRELAQSIEIEANVPVLIVWDIEIQ